MNKREWDSLSGLEKRTVIAERELERLGRTNADLLAALKELAHQERHRLQAWKIETEPPELTRAFAVIAKAEGVP